MEMREARAVMASGKVPVRQVDEEIIIMVTSLFEHVTPVQLPLQQFGLSVVFQDENAAHVEEVLDKAEAIVRSVDVSGLGLLAYA